MVKAKYKMSEVKKAMRDLSDIFNRSGVKVSSMFLYGSYARNEPREYSDIDVAIISSDFCGKNRMVIQEIIAGVLTGRTGIMSAIELIGYSTDEFARADSTTFLGEIKHTGKRLIPS